MWWPSAEVFSPSDSGIRARSYSCAVKIISVSPRCLACGRSPDDPERCHPTPDRLEQLQWFRDQPGFELRENIGNGHVVAVGVEQPKPASESPPQEA